MVANKEAVAFWYGESNQTSEFRVINLTNIKYHVIIISCVPGPPLWFQPSYPKHWRYCEREGRSCCWWERENLANEYPDVREEDVLGADVKPEGLDDDYPDEKDDAGPSRWW